MREVKRRAQIRQWLEIAWLVLVFGAVALYIGTNFNDIMTQLRQVSLVGLILSFGALVIARLLLPLIALHSVATVHAQPTYRRMFYVTSVSQLGKYLPGSIWQFVGKAALYQADGLSVGRSVQALVLENLWLLSAAGFVGVCFLLVALADGMAILATAGILGAWIAVIYLTLRRYPEMNTLSDIATLWASQAVLWVFFGSSLWLLMASQVGVVNLPLLLGSFCISFIVGFIVVIAPGGIGVREAVLVALLATILPADEVLIFAGVHRFLWILAELLMGLIAMRYAQ